MNLLGIVNQYVQYLPAAVLQKIVNYYFAFVIMGYNDKMSYK